MADLTISVPGTFDEAVKWAEARGVVLSEEFYNVLKEGARGRSFTVTGLAGLDQIQKTLDSLNESLKTGETFADWKKRFGPELDLPDARLETIFRNHMQNAYNAGRWRQFEDNKDNRPYLMFSAISDSRTTAFCRSHNGIIRKINDPLWNRASPPCHHQCYLPGTMARGDFEIGLKSFYSGPAIQITTYAGNTLSVTSNHPILTRNGWVSANEIKENDNLLCDNSGINSPLVGIVNNQNPPIVVEKLFKSLAAHALGVADITTFDFHNDVEFRKGNVSISGSKCKLMFGFKPDSFKLFYYWDFVRAATIRRISHSTICHSIPAFVNAILHKDANNVLRASFKFFRNCIAAFVDVFVILKDVLLKSIIKMGNRFPCGFTLPFSSARSVFYSLPLFNLGLASSSYNNSISNKKVSNTISANSELFSKLNRAISFDVPVDNFRAVDRIPKTGRNWPFSASHSGFAHTSFFDPVIAKQPIKQATTDPALFEHLAHSNAGLIQIDKVKSIRNFSFTGHVYNFHTSSGMIVANGIITHNCRSTLISLSESQAIKRSPGTEGINKPNPSELIPDGWGYKPTGDDAATGLVKALADKTKGLPMNWLASLLKFFSGGWSALISLIRKLF